MHVYVRFRTDDFPVIGSVDRMAYCSASHIVRGWCARQPPVHRIWRALCRGTRRASDTKRPKRHLAEPHVDTSAAPRCAGEAYPRQLSVGTTMYGIFEGLFVSGHVTQLPYTLYNTYHANVTVVFMVSIQGRIEGPHLARDQTESEL